mgnify:CR=1 FL=1
MTEPSVRIFVSSPSDLEHERALVKDIIGALSEEFRPYFGLQPVLWEEEALTAAQSFQAGLVPPSACEIVLVMLWSRLGTPLADDPYGGMTGTEWEFVDAVEASARHGSPEVLVYKKIAPRLVDINDTEAVGAAVADRGRLDVFFRTHFFNPDGSFRRAFRQFDNDFAFRELVETQLRKLLNRRLSAERRFAAGLLDWQGSPFRPASPYGFGDERIFTGREIETRELVARLDAMRGAGRGLLLLTGPSGVGKTSLLRAGLLPHLARPFLFTEIGGCRWCLLEPDARDPLTMLAAALTGAGMLGPALTRDGLDAEQLARSFETAPTLAAEQVQAALMRTASDEQSRSGRRDGKLQLALILDPLDQLLQPPAASAAHRVFATALIALAARDGIWVVGALGSQHLPALGALPELASALDERGWFTLEPVAHTRIRQVMEIPARVAGLAYEEGGKTSGPGLVEAMESEASRLRHWPHLLEWALDALRQQASAQHGRLDPSQPCRLGARDFETMGRLAGVVLRRADAVWGELDAETRDALPRLCRALVTLDDGPGSRPVARVGDLDSLLRDAATARLVRTLTAARLVVAEGVPDPLARIRCAPLGQGREGRLQRALEQLREEWRARHGRTTEVLDGPPETAAEARPATAWDDYRAVLSFVHPALFEQWEPVTNWLAAAENRETLRLRHQLGRQARQWKRTACNQEYLLGEAGYAALRHLAHDDGAGLEPLEHDFLQHSWSRLRQQRRRNRRTLGATLAVLATLAGIAVFAIMDADHEARLNRQRLVLHEAELAIERGNTPRALRLALTAGPDLPQQGSDTLARALSGNRLLALYRAQPDTHGGTPVFSSDGERLATVSRDDGVQLWRRDGPHYRRETSLAAPELGIRRLAFVDQETDTFVLGIGGGGMWRLPASPGQPPDWTCGGGEDAVVALDPSGQYLAIAHDGPPPNPVHAICLLDLSRPGAALWDQAQPTDAVRGLGFAPDGKRLVSASRDGRARVMDTLDGRERLLLPRQGPLGRPFSRAIFSPDGRQVAAASVDETIRIYGEDGEEVDVLGAVRRGKRLVRIHQSAIRDIAYSPDGLALVAGDSAGQVVRWDMRSRGAELLGQHDLGVDRVSLSPVADSVRGEFLVLTQSQDKTAWLWTLETGKRLAVFGQDAAVTDARFSRDGKRVMTTARQDGSARLWSLETRDPQSVAMPQEDHVLHLAIAAAPDTPGGEGPTAPSLLVATAAYDGRLDLWRYDRTRSERSPVRLRSFEGHDGRVRRVTFSPSTRLLASAGTDGTARVWGLAAEHVCRYQVTSQPGVCRTPDAPDCPNVHQVLFAPDERWLVSTSSDAEQPLRLWDTDTCAALPAPEAFAAVEGAVQSAALAPSADGGAILGLGSDDGTVRLLRLHPSNGWTQVCRWGVHQGAISEVSLSRDGHWLAAASRDGRASLYALPDAASDQVCEEPRLLDPGAGSLYAVQFAPDSKALVTAAAEATADVWSVDGRQLARLAAHRNRVVSAQFSPDGSWILTGSRDGRLRIWRRPLRVQDTPPTPFLTLDPNLGSLTIARFSPDGHSIAAGYWDNAALLWRIWDEERQPATREIRRWGQDRARSVLLRDAIRLRDVLDSGGTE